MKREGNLRSGTNMRVKVARWLLAFAVILAPSLSSPSWAQAPAFEPESFLPTPPGVEPFVKFTQLDGKPVWLSPSESACVRTPIVFTLDEPKPSGNKNKRKKGRKQAESTIDSGALTSFAKAKSEVCSHDQRNTFLLEPPEEVAAKLGMKVFFHTPNRKLKVWLNARDISIVRYPTAGNAASGAHSEACMHDVRCFWFAEEPEVVAEKLKAAVKDLERP